MSQNNANTCEQGSQIENPGAFARHADACEVCTREGSSESQDGDAIRPDDLKITEVEHATANMGANDFEATLEALDFKPKESDTARTATAKALVDAKGGGKSRYVAVFDECADPDCDYGANGFESDKCARHESDDEPASEPDDSDSESDDEPATRETASEPANETRADYVAQLIEVGVDPVKAEEAATARFD